ncbi:hypothetical protein ANCCAN_24334 [Ancylostoma caninum]|uniref:Uncharacterized protein n=1 Tax=Ancylostoma caninum TaxID=29170 RepID=A0A368FCJ8_ANCCA|nr:hypothetical protein ANCCAN_24334 [Ancylostoma caninum]
MTHKFCGWQSDFSYTLLRMMNIVGAIFYATEFVGHLRFILSTPYATIDRFIGAVFMACFLTDTLIGMCLVAHRVVYTIIPFKAERILTPVVLKISLLFIAVYFVAMTCFMCTPVAGVMYCPRSMTRYIVKASLTVVINGMNTVSNYLVGISTITAYTFLLIFLFIRGNITFRSNAELRMMVQASYYRLEREILASPKKRQSNRLASHNKPEFYPAVLYFTLISLTTCADRFSTTI